MTKTIPIAIAGLLATAAAHAQILLPNGGFETIGVPVTSFNLPFVQTAQSNVSPWSTTASDGKIEIWASGMQGGAPAPVFASTGSGLLDGGTNFAELNATQSSALYQTVNFTDSGFVDYAFLHRGRAAGSDTMRLAIIRIVGTSDWVFNSGLGTFSTPGNDMIVVNQTYTSSHSAWNLISVDNAFQVTAGETYVFAYGSVSTASNDSTIGNFIDNAAFGIDILPPVVSPIPEPSTYGMIGAGLLVAFAAYRRRPSSK